MINENLISESQTEYVMGILNLIVESSSSGAADESDGLIKFPLFCVIAALSQRIVALESTVARCINKLDLRALKTKLFKARDMFVMNDHDNKVGSCQMKVEKS